MKNKINAYKNLNIKRDINSMTDANKILALYDQVVSNTKLSIQYIGKNKIPAKVKLMDNSIQIIDALSGSLDEIMAPELTKSLKQYYQTVMTILLQANTENDVEALKSLIPILTDLRDTWQQAGGMN